MNISPATLKRTAVIINLSLVGLISLTLAQLTCTSLSVDKLPVYDARHVNIAIVTNTTEPVGIHHVAHLHLFGEEKPGDSSNEEITITSNHFEFPKLTLTGILFHEDPLQTKAFILDESNSENAYAQGALISKGCTIESITTDNVVISSPDHKKIVIALNHKLTSKG